MAEQDNRTQALATTERRQERDRDVNPKGEWSMAPKNDGHSLSRHGLLRLSAMATSAGMLTACVVPVAQRGQRQ